MSDKDTILAICYDFDKTLTPKDMQAQGFIQSVGYDVEDFWRESNGLAEKNNMDQNLAYMYTMIDKAEGNFYLSKERLEEYGSRVELFPGVQGWFERINQYGKEKGIVVEHYIISSGIKEMIDGTEIAKKGMFKAIYANSFFFNEKGVPRWPSLLVNYTNKTQYLFRIKKGVLDVSDQRVNDRFKEEDVRIPFRNIIYIGDSDTDIPCMTVVNEEGGYSIGVYASEEDSKHKVYRMMREGRIKFFAPADYSEGKELDRIIKSIIDKTVAAEMLENKYISNKKEVYDFDQSNNEWIAANKRLDLILDLERSNSFKNTHLVIKEMLPISTWNEKEIEMICDIALKNGQVRGVLLDTDVKSFYNRLLDVYSGKKEIVQKIREYIS